MAKITHESNGSTTKTTVSTTANDPSTMKPSNMLVPIEMPPLKDVNYSIEEISVRGDYIMRLNLARYEREQRHPELDMMTYLEYYESNRKKDLSFIEPRINEEDVRIVTGTTREKDNTLLGIALNLNQEADITAFNDDDIMVSELGRNMSDLVKKSLQIENWEKKRGIIYREMISQGDVFVQEIYREEFQSIPLGDLNWDPTKDKVADLSFKERLQLVFAGCERRFVNGKKVYLGSVRISYVEDQDLVAVLNVYSRAKAKTIYGQWERWEYVPYTIANTTEVFPEDGHLYRDWNLLVVPYDKVAEIMIYDKRRNRFQIMLNGVMMLPVNYPLTGISPDGSIGMAQGKFEPISDFAYSKSQPSKTKIDQEVLDEVTIQMIDRFRKVARPPLGNAGKKVYSESIFMAGSITQDVREGDLFPILKEAGTGITPGEFSFYNLIKTNIDNNTVDKPGADPADGSVPPPSATQIQQIQNDKMLKLGLLMDSLINFERQMTWMRINNIIHKWLKPIEPTIDQIRAGVKDAYKNISVQTSLEDGQSGNKIFSFGKRDAFPDAHTHRKLEDSISKHHGMPTRVIYMDPDMLRAMKWRWFIVISPTPRTNDQLAQMLFVQNIETALNIFGPSSLNMDYLKQRFAIMIKEDPSKFFVKSSILDQLKQQNGQGSNQPQIAQNAPQQQVQQPQVQPQQTQVAPQQQPVQSQNQPIKLASPRAAPGRAVGMMKKAIRK